MTKNLRNIKITVELKIYITASYNKYIKVQVLEILKRNFNIVISAPCTIDKSLQTCPCLSLLFPHRTEITNSRSSPIDVQIRLIVFLRLPHTWDSKSQDQDCADRRRVYCIPIVDFRLQTFFYRTPKILWKIQCNLPLAYLGMKNYCNFYNYFHREAVLFF